MVQQGSWRHASNIDSQNRTFQTNLVEQIETDRGKKHAYMYYVQFIVLDAVYKTESFS